MFDIRNFHLTQAVTFVVASACREFALGMQIRCGKIAMAAQPGSAKTLDQFSRPAKSP